MPLSPDKLPSVDNLRIKRDPILTDALADRVRAVAGAFPDGLPLAELDHLNERTRDVRAKKLMGKGFYLKYPKDVSRPPQWDDLLKELAQENFIVATGVVSAVGLARSAGLQTVGDLRDASRLKLLPDGGIVYNRSFSGIPAAFCLRAFAPIEEPSSGN